MDIKLRRYKGNPLLEAVDKRAHWWERAADGKIGVASIGKEELLERLAIDIGRVR